MGGYVSARSRFIAMVAAFSLMLMAGGLARAQTADGGTVAPIALGARGGFAGGAKVQSAPSPERAGEPLEISARTGFATDYVYRGTTLSDRRPAMGAGVEAAFSTFYAGATIASVRLPSQPAAEVAISGGVRPKLWDIEFDFGATYFLYPRETWGSPGIEYWEVAARADKRINETLRIAGGFAYSPNVSNTGAWSKYVAAGLGIDLPASVLPENIAASFTGGAGYFWFGNQEVALGGLPLPAYLNWNAGVTLTRGGVSLDLRYHDTNLSKEKCFLFTGDPGAAPGGRVDPVSNPQGLTSRWCGAALVAKLLFELN
jgi:uncharacterized protein (TIGR02001 family)